MTADGFAIFQTAIGACGVAWSGRGITAVQLPERDLERTRARLVRSSPGAHEGTPPPDVQEAVDAIAALLDGEPRDLSAVVLDIERRVPAVFNRRVYAIARTIPPGRTLTYGEIAARLGEPGAAQAVGQALGQNPFPIVVPCHRVVAAGGKTGGFSANGGVATKLRLLAIEGAPGYDQPTLFA
jgi:methylated-DNA-[protein]-cysteine S-methyltransferase